jgi:hypothetical protein
MNQRHEYLLLEMVEPSKVPTNSISLFSCPWWLVCGNVREYAENHTHCKGSIVKVRIKHCMTSVYVPVVFGRECSDIESTVFMWI